jgi:hypothetical protein
MFDSWRNRAALVLCFAKGWVLDANDMAFSFTYKEIFSRVGFSRTWLERSRRDHALRYGSILGFVLAYCVAALIAGDFPPRKELLAPFIYLGNLDVLPVVALFPVVFYLCSWIADEFPLGSRQVIILAGVPGIVVYGLSSTVHSPGLFPSRIPFFVYAVAIIILASVQTARIRSEPA